MTAMVSPLLVLQQLEILAAVYVPSTDVHDLCKNDPYEGQLNYVDKNSYKYEKNMALDKQCQK